MPPSLRAPPRSLPRIFWALLPVLTGCGGEEVPSEEEPVTASSAPASESLNDLLARGEVAFGIFSGDKTAEQGAAIVSNRETDFILYSLESGPFDIPAMEAYMAGMAKAGRSAGVEPQPVLLRIPPLHETPDEAAGRVAQSVAAGVRGIVFPHVVDAAEAALSVTLMTEAAPAEGGSDLLDVLIVEDLDGVRNAREIVATVGLSVVFAGPGDLRRAYDGDLEQVEAAIQTILAACLEFAVPCGVTAGSHDIGRRIEEGFRVIIATEPEALAVGRAVAGRSGGR